MNIVKSLLLVSSVLLIGSQDAQDKKYHNGREIVTGPVFDQIVQGKHIISDSIGVVNYDGVLVIDSVIEAPICMEVGSMHNTIKRNILICDGCIKFAGNPLINNTVVENHCYGNLSNRPDAF